ncbi:DEAD/DEAH box helicase [Candidatus Parcubacteria bacterium]|nr:DEAD/DEAH box helicase [Candidatus Parcubacteria bacterium]
MTQTPAFLGDIRGGLTLPRLVRGVHFAAAFPDLRGHQATSAITSLAPFGIPNSLIHEWSERFRGGLNQLQVDAVNTGRILDGQSLLVISPTSSGKTFVGEMAAAKAVVEGRKAVFLLPYRALVNEKYDQFIALYGGQLAMRIVRCTGDYADQVDPFVRGKYDLGLLTYEMFLRLAVSQPQILNQIELVVVDEAQFITDPTRGISVELILTYLIAVRERGIAPQLIALSAVIGDSNNFPDWLGCKALVSSHRPVPLREGVLDRSGMFQCLEADGTVSARELSQILGPLRAAQMELRRPATE